MIFISIGNDNKKEFISAQPDVQAITMRNDKISTQAIDTIYDLIW